jgi:hypothetical protein
LQQQKKARLQQKARAKNTNTFFQQKQNEDGHPMKLCTCEPLEKRFVYCPPGYCGVNSAGGKHCCACHLKPCVAEECREETNDFFFNLQIAERKPNLVASPRKDARFLAQEILQSHQETSPEEAQTTPVHC